MQSATIGSRELTRAEQQAHDLWVEAKQELGGRYLLQHGLRFEDVYEAIIYPKHEIIFDDTVDLGVDDSGRAILGKFLPDENVALVDCKLAKTHSQEAVYVSWHETAGHGVYQGNFLRQHSNVIRTCISTEEKEWLSLENQLENDAHRFSCYAAAPPPFVSAVLHHGLDVDRLVRFDGPGFYTFLDDSIFAETPWTLADQIAARLRPWFGGMASEHMTPWVLEEIIYAPDYLSYPEMPKVHRASELISEVVSWL